MIIIANNLSEGYLIYTFVFVIFVVLFLSSMRWGKEKALTYSAFVTGVVLLLLNVAGLVQYWMIVLDGVLLMIGLFLVTRAKTIG